LRPVVLHGFTFATGQRPTIMLRSLYIRNYAIISELRVDFNAGLNIITGETGAGKSILMGALGLVLGNRADSSVLYDTSGKCVVEAIFEPQPSAAISRFFAGNDLDEELPVIIRREIAPGGKSRGFINDTPATLTQLKALTSLLVDLHQQFDTLELGDYDFQREVLDALAGQLDRAKEYQVVFANYAACRRKLEEQKARQAEANKELDYYRFLHSELAEANFTEGEVEQLEQEQEMLSNAENIKRGLEAVAYALGGSEQPVDQQVKWMAQQLQAIKGLGGAGEQLAQRLHSAYVELHDIAGEVDQLNDKIHLDPARLQQVQERLDLAYRLMKKHGASDTAGLLAAQHDLEQKLQQVLNLESDIAATEKELTLLKEQTTARALELRKGRQQVSASLEKDLARLLKQVGMPNAALQVHMQPLGEPGPDGADDISFLFDANRSGRFEPLHKVASGGELSRLMLSIKSLVAQKMQLPTLIFDEIDTGISGEAARQVGIIMRSLAQKHQVISITHQAQIAARAHAHYYVYKQADNGKITTQLRLLQHDERVKTIAAMLSGEQATEAALQAAREMVEG